MNSIATPQSDAGRGLAARRLMRRKTHAALATSLGGQPYASLVAVACEHDASPLLLLSNLAQHSRNIAADPRVSLLFDGSGQNHLRAPSDPLAEPRLSIIGEAARCDNPRLLARFTARHPSAAVYAGFGDFHLYRVTIGRGHLVAGFGRINWIEAGDLRFVRDAAALAAAEPDILVHMNADHADAVDLFAARLLRSPGAGWRMIGIDPEGIDLRRPVGEGGETARLDFPQPVLDADAARRTLIALTRAARAAPET
jgi:putative heme iron utilization protein